MTYRLNSSASVGEVVAGVHIDESGNFTARTHGNPRALAHMLRLIAEQIDLNAPNPYRITEENN